MKKLLAILAPFQYPALIVLLLLITLIGIFNRDLQYFDELRESEIGREFLDHHNWAVPTLNNQPFMEKPPLVYWFVALSFRIFGNHDWAARIPCVIFGWGILLFTFLLVKKVYGNKTGIASVLVLATTGGFLSSSHKMTCDIGLFFFITGAAYFLYLAFTGSEKWYGLFYLFPLGAFFSKGLIGFGFIGLLFLAWVIWTRNPKEILRARPWLWLPVIAIPIIIWFIALSHDSRGNLLYTFLVENNLHRFFPPDEYHLGHTHPFYDAFYQMPSQFLPWVLVLIMIIPWLWKQRQQEPIKFLLSWFIPGFLMLTVSGTKRGLYFIPLLPPLAIMVTAWFHAKTKEYWLIIISVIIGVAFIITFDYNLLKINDNQSAKPFYRELSSKITPDTKIYGYNVTEVTYAAIPFYTGRYFTPISTESELAQLSRETNTRNVIITITHNNDRDFKTVNRYFPYIWLTYTVGNDRILNALSNVPLKNPNEK